MELGMLSTSLPIKRELTAASLGFREPTHNSLDAVSDRDFAADFLYACAVTMMHLSRLAEEIRTRTGVRVERQKQALDALRAELTEEEQTLLVLRIDQQLSWDEIAEVMGDAAAPLDAAALRKRFERLKEKLTKLAKERGLVA